MGNYGQIFRRFFLWFSPLLMLRTVMGSVFESVSKIYTTNKKITSMVQTQIAFF